MTPNVAMVGHALAGLAAVSDDPDQIAAHLERLGVRGWRNDAGYEGVLPWYLAHVMGQPMCVTRYEPGQPFYALADDPAAPPDDRLVHVRVPDVLGEMVVRFDAGAYPALAYGDAEERRHRIRARKDARLPPDPADLEGVVWWVPADQDPDDDPGEEMPR
jgi:hypothetical protein